jgi:hypothetical protein
MEFLSKLLTVCISFYTTSVSGEYNVEYTVPVNMTAFYSNKVTELQNFSSLFTGILSSYSMDIQYQVIGSEESRLGIINVTREISHPQVFDYKFIDYEKDFYNYFLSGNNSKFKNCSDYFADCSTASMKTISSRVDKDSSLKTEYYLMNQMLSVLDKPNSLTQLNTNLLKESQPTKIKYSVKSNITLSHLRVGTAFYYVVLFLICAQILVLVYNIVLLVIKRNKLKERISLLKVK